MPLITIPLGLAALTGVLSYVVFVSIRLDLAKIDPDALREMDSFDNRLAAWLFRVNMRKVRTFMKHVRHYGDRRLTMKVQIYRALGAISTILAGGSILLVIIMQLARRIR